MFHSEWQFGRFTGLRNVKLRFSIFRVIRRSFESLRGHILFILLFFWVGDLLLLFRAGFLLLLLLGLIDADIEVGVLALWLICDRLTVGFYEAALDGLIDVLEIEDLFVILPRAQDLMSHGKLLFRQGLVILGRPMRVVDLFPHKNIIDLGGAQIKQQGSTIRPIEEAEYPEAEGDVDMIQYYLRQVA